MSSPTISALRYVLEDLIMGLGMGLETSSNKPLLESMLSLMLYAAGMKVFQIFPDFQIF